MLDIDVELTSREIIVRDWTGQASNHRMAAIARARVPGERLRLRLDGRDVYGPCHVRVYTRTDNLR